MSAPLQLLDPNLQMESWDSGTLKRVGSVLDDQDEITVSYRILNRHGETPHIPTEVSAERFEDLWHTQFPLRCCDNTL